MGTTGGEFYEDDEPVAEVRAAFERGAKDITAPPHGLTLYVTVESSSVVVVPESSANAPVHAVG